MGECEIIVSAHFRLENVKNALIPSRGIADLQNNNYFRTR